VFRAGPGVRFRVAVLTFRRFVPAVSDIGIVAVVLILLVTVFA
jgi:hypothetical protein